MPGMDKPTGRVVALLVLLLVVSAALRGYLPASRPCGAWRGGQQPGGADIRGGDPWSDPRAGGDRGYRAVARPARGGTASRPAVRDARHRQGPTELARVADRAGGHRGVAADRDAGGPPAGRPTVLGQAPPPPATGASPPEHRQRTGAAAATSAEREHVRHPARRHRPDDVDHRRGHARHVAAAVARSDAGHRRRRSGRIPGTADTFGITGAGSRTSDWPR